MLDIQVAHRFHGGWPEVQRHPADGSGIRQLQVVVMLLAAREVSDRWSRQLAAWAIPETVLAAAPESPWGFPPGLFARSADRALTPCSPRRGGARRRRSGQAGPCSTSARAAGQPASPGAVGRLACRRRREPSHARRVRRSGRAARAGTEPTTGRGTAAWKARPATRRSSRCAPASRARCLGLLSRGVPMILGGGVAAHRASPVDGDPDTALRVDGEPVGRADVCRDLEE